MALPVFERNQAALEQAQQAERQREQQANGPFILNPRPGRTTFRVMPPWDERGMWYHEIREHNFFAGQTPTPFLCTEPTQGRCPICEYGAALAANGDEEAAKKFKPSTKFFLNVIVFSDSTGKNNIKSGIIVMQVGSTVKKALLDYDLDVNGGYGDITDYSHGFDINMDKVGTGLATKYTVKVNPNRNDVLARLASEGVDPETLSLHALDQIRQELSYEELSEQFQAVMSAPTNQPQAQAVPVATKPTPVKPTQTPAPAAPAPSVKKFTPPAGGPTVAGVKISPPPLPGRK